MKFDLHLVLIPFLALSSLAFADDSSTDSLEDLPLTLSESNLPDNPRKVFNSVYVIDRNMIAAANARTIGDLLKMVPGMVVGYRFGHWMSLGYHGNTEQTMRRINIVVDGRSIYTPTSGGFVSFNTPVQVEDMERIEVFRGPAHADFGSNSIGITIKIYTANAAEKQGTGAVGRVGTNEIRDGYIQHGDKFGNTAVTLSGYQAEDHGVKNSEDNRRNRQVFMRADTQLTNSDEISYSMGYGEGDLDYWQSADFTSNDHDGNDRSWFMLGTWRHAWEDGSDFTVDASYTSMTRNTYYLSGPRPVVGRVFYEPNIAYDRYELDTKLSKNVTDTFSYSFGTQLRRDMVESKNYFMNPEYTVLDVTAFGRFNWEFLPTWAASLGWMRNYTETSHESVDALSLNIIKELNQNQSVRVGYNEGVRQPLVYEQHAGRKQYLVDRGNLPVYEIVTVGHVSPEKTVTYDLSWMYQNDLQTWSSELRFFYDDYKNLIVHGPVANPGYTSLYGARIISPYNLDNPGSAKGIEFSTKWNISSRLMAMLSASTQDIDSNVDIDNLYSGAGEAGPERVAALMLEYSFDHQVKLGAQVNHVSSYNWTRSQEIPEQNNIDLVLSKCFNFGSEVCGTVAVDNLLGDQSDFSPDIETKRVYWTSLSIKY